MLPEERKNLADFYIVGINYRKTDATVRGQFAINNQQYANLFTLASSFGVSEFFILSTCNRTEVYGFAQEPSQLAALLCQETPGSLEQFEALCYIKKGRAAADHLFSVSAGLDSQVLGDYEILGQMKIAAKFSKSHGFLGSFMERLVNSCLQASKAIKTKTHLSDGTVSVSFAAIQFVKENVAKIKDKKILLVGLGKIGGNTCKNIVDYLGTKNVCLVNRTREKATVIADQFGLHTAPLEELDAQIEQSDIIITATSAPTPLIRTEHVNKGAQKILIDLSIPYNIDPSVAGLDNVTLLNVDDLSKMKDETLRMREGEVPKAKDIINTHLDEFMQWCAMRSNVPVLLALKKQLNNMDRCPFLSKLRGMMPEGQEISEEKIQKLINSTAVKLKSDNSRGCHYIEAINEFIAG